MMNIAEIIEYLPHRYPFLLVDRVDELYKGEYISATKNISVNEPFFEGHFPNMPVMPGVLIVEAMAQTAGILGFKTMEKMPSDDCMYLLSGVQKARFKRQVIPGDVLSLEAEVISKKMGLWYFDCTAKVGGELAASAEILCYESSLVESSA